ncbi:MAG: glycoside hydrolase family 13 protein [Fimbriimonadaceae bacterium]|nr:glycoside hydrolase family 13 protein [Fimbriimonadaceae bacterium]
MIAILALAGMLSPAPTLAPVLEDRVATMRRRDADWRVGPIVYQVFVDRFVPPANLEAKRALYAAPRRLMTWDQEPQPGRPPTPETGVWSHELDFWGGDLPGVRSKLDHVAALADVLYLNPIHSAWTNHKYDATDWGEIAPEYGTWADYRGLVGDLKKRRMRLVLDGVFNHCGRANPLFKEAQTGPASKYRDWFYFGTSYPGGYRAWARVPNLPEVNLENKATRDYLWNRPDSIVAKWLKEGADGWRLDVAHEIGPEYLAELTQAAHAHKKGSLVIGEVWNYPAGWTDAMDGLLNVFLGRFIVDYTHGVLTSRQAAVALQQLVQDCGVEPLLRSWIVLANHDTARLATQIPDAEERRFAQTLQFVLPGAPMIYYGDELGMPGGDDPRQRGSMKWDKVREDNADLAWTRKLVAMRRKVRALRVGDFRAMVGEKLLGFLRTTEKALEGTIVVANPTDAPVTEAMVVPDPTLMGYTLLKDELSGEKLRVFTGVIRVSVPPRTVRVLTIDEEAIGRGQYKRMKDG